MVSLTDLPIEYRITIARYVTFLRYLGIDFFNDLKPTEKVIRLFVFNIFFLPFALNQFTLISEINADDFLEGARVVPLAVMFLLDLLKLGTSLFKRDKFNYIFMEILDLWPKDKLNPEKADILKTWTRKMSLLLYSFYVYAMVNLVLFEIFPAITTILSSQNGDVVYLLPFKFGNRWQVNSTFSFVVTYLWELACTMPCQAWLYVPYDLLTVTITSNVSVLFRLLQVDLENCIKNDRAIEVNGKTISNDLVYNELTKLVKVHERLLSLSKKLSEVFGLVIFVHVAVSAIIICFFGYLTVVFGGVADTIANLLSVLNSVVIIFFLALAGELLSDTSTKVADAAYNCLWYDCDGRVKKLILIIIIRSQRPSYLSALGYSDMTLRAFSKIMSSAWTYFSLLVQMTKK